MDFLFIVEDANLRGGTEIQTFNLMSAICDRGKDSMILSLTPYKGNDSHVLSLTETEYKRWSSKSGSLLDRLSFRAYSDLFLRKTFRDYAERYNVTAIICQTYDIITALPSERWAVQVLNWSIIGYESSILCRINKKRGIKKYLSLFTNVGVTFRRHRCLQHISRIVVLSSAAVNELLELNPRIKASNVITIPNALTVREDRPHVSSLENKNLVFVGRLSQEKGVMRLLRIWGRVRLQLSDYSLSVYGEGSAMDEMRAYIADHQMDRVYLKGFCRNLEDIYKHADLLLMTSDTEGFGLVLIEAMYYGVPCVAFDCPVSPKEIIADAGVTLPCFDEEAYANEVVALLRDKNRLRDLQIRALNRAKDFYIDKVIKLWIEMLNSVD